jgi:xanthine dehydrogenase accessory factor
MRDIIPTLREWQRKGKRYALATLIKVDRSAPKPPGAAMAVCEDGTVAGSVSGGCVESALHEQAAEVIDSGVPRTVSYGLSDAEGWNVGLACGGQLHLFVDRPALPGSFLDDVEANRPVALTTKVSGDGAGRRMAVHPDDQSLTADPVGADAQILLARRASELRSYPEGEFFIQTFAPPPAMYVFGAADFSAAMARMGKFLGYHVTVIDPREVFATRERFPDADQVVVDWPDRFLEKAHIDSGTAVIVMTHDPKFDIPALACAVTTGAGYIGAMGARRTNEERFRKLREAGCTEDQLARIHAPIGLDIGGKSPEETAVAIAAQIIAMRSGKTGRML